MGEVVVNALPQTAPISDMRNRQSELLHMAEHGPVVLLSRSKPAAILLSPDLWDAIAEALAQLRRSSEVAEKLVTVSGANGNEQEIEALHIHVYTLPRCRHTSNKIAVVAQARLSDEATPCMWM